QLPHFRRAGGRMPSTEMSEPVERQKATETEDQATKCGGESLACNVAGSFVRIMVPTCDSPDMQAGLPNKDSPFSLGVPQPFEFAETACRLAPLEHRLR